MQVLFAALVFSALVSLSVQQTSVQHGTYNYTTYEVGGANSVVIISAPHGGTWKPTEVANRSTAGCYDAVEDECIYEPSCGTVSTSECDAVTSSDYNTQKLAREVADAIKAKLGNSDAYRPHVIINELHRSKLDANRDLDEATFGDARASTAWFDYHGFIDAAKTAATSGGRRAMYIDMHGQSKSEGWSMVGFLISKDGSRGLDKTVIRNRVSVYSSINQLHHDTGVSMEELVRGSNSIGGIMEAKGYSMVPSPANKDPGSASYYSGGYSLRRHTGWEISGFQMEAHYSMRSNTAIRQQFADDLADTIITWLNDYY